MRIVSRKTFFNQSYKTCSNTRAGKMNNNLFNTTFSKKTLCQKHVFVFGVQIHSNHFQRVGLLHIVSRIVFEDSAISSDPQLIGVAQHLIDRTTVPLSF